MRSEIFHRSGARRTRALLWLPVVWLAICGTLSASAAAAQAAAQAASAASYDAQAFIQELQRLKRDLEPASSSTESLRTYREALPKTWSVDAGDRHYVVPTSLLASRLTKAEKAARSPRA